MADVSTGMYASDVTITVQRAGTLHGLGGWFEAQLSPSVTLTNSPVATTRMQRRNAVFPIQEPVDVRPGDEVAVSMQFRGPETLINWKVEVWARSATGERRRTAASSHSTFKGLLFSHEDLVRLRPDSRPVLDERGRARMTVLELCDGSRPLMEIEQEVYHRHRTLFGTDRNAAGFVAEVITRYTHPRAGS